MLFRNTLWQAAPKLSGYLFSLVLAPIMLARLGLAQFGVWAVTGALATYAVLLDLGISRALARYVALYDAQGDRRGIQECAGLGLLAIGAVGLVAAGAAMLAAPLLAGELGVLDTPAMRLVLLSSVAILTFDTLAGVLNAVPIGLRRMLPPNVADTAGTLANLVFSVIALALSTQLTDYALANAAASLLSLAFSVVGFAYVWSRPYVSLPSPARTREIVRFAVKNQVSWLADLINLQTDKVIIALLLGPSAAGAYEIGSRVVLAVRSVGVLTVSAIIPTATAAIVEQGRHIVGDFYRRYTKPSVAVAFPLFGLACVSAPFLLVAWLGESPGASELVVVVLSAAYFVNITTGVASTVAISDGRPGEVAWTSAVTALLNVAGTVALAPFFGIWGVVGATFLAVTAGSALFLARFHRIYGLPLRDLLRSAGPPAGLAIALALPFAVWHAVIGASADARPAALVGLAVTAGGYGLAYWLLASWRHYLPDRLSPSAMAARLRAHPRTTTSVPGPPLP